MHFATSTVAILVSSLIGQAVAAGAHQVHQQLHEKRAATGKGCGKANTLPGHKTETLAYGAKPTFTPTIHAPAYPTPTLVHQSAYNKTTSSAHDGQHGSYNTTTSSVYDHHNSHITTKTSAYAHQSSYSTTTPSAVIVLSSSPPAVKPVHFSSSSAAVWTAPRLTTKPTLSATTLATVTKSASSTATSTTAPITPKTGKRGLAYNDVSLTTNFLTSDSKVSFGYNWGQVSGGLSPKIEYIPLLWGLQKYGQDYTKDWAKNAAAAIAAGSSHLFSFNEPDLPAQSDLTPAQAAAGYKTYMMPFAGKAWLGAPAVTNGGSPMGLTWLKSFISECTDCEIDFCAIHWYDSATNIDYFKNYMADAHTACGANLYISEFAGSGTEDEQITFLKTVLPWLDAQDFIHGYAYFMVTDGVLLSNGNTLSALGQVYNTY